VAGNSDLKDTLKLAWYQFFYWLHSRAYLYFDKKAGENRHKLLEYKKKVTSVKYGKPKHQYDEY
jgi:hypothetical protein